MKNILLMARAVLILSPVIAFAADKPEDFAIRFSVQTVKGASLQRLALPKEALAALQSATAADVRVFNGNGQAVPIATIPLRTVTIAGTPQAWPIYPIMGTPHPQQALQQKQGNLSLRIERSADRSIVRVIEGAGPHPASLATQQIATLVDTRPLKGLLAELNVDAALPAGEPIALTIMASQDLKNWRTLAQDVPVFRFGAAADAPGNMRIPLSGVRLDEDYLRISWPPDATFSLRGVSITPAASTEAPRRLAVPLVAQPDGDGFVIAVPFATPMQALDIRPADPNTLVPVRLSGRSARGEPWRTLTTGVVYRVQSGGAESHAPPIELNNVSVRELRIDPTTRTAVPTAPPHVNALLNPREWVFVVSGPPPFTLAVGRAGSDSVPLPLASLIPGYTPGAENTLPIATVNVASAIRQPTHSLTRFSEALGAPSARSLILWVVLIGGVLVLAGVAWMVMRQMKPPRNPPA